MLSLILSVSVSLSVHERGSSEWRLQARLGMMFYKCHYWLVYKSVCFCFAIIKVVIQLWNNFSNFLRFCEISEESRTRVSGLSPSINSTVTFITSAKVLYFPNFGIFNFTYKFRNLKHYNLDFIKEDFIFFWFNIHNRCLLGMRWTYNPKPRNIYPWNVVYNTMRQITIPKIKIFFSLKISYWP